jgi:uncharacterized membrane protein YjjP (DUF1212 family)
MDINRIIHIAANAGRIILQSGGETYRVEETILRICNAFGINNADSFVTPTGIMLSAADEYGQTISLVKRIHFRTVDLEKISKVNDLSRNIKNQGYTLEYVEHELDKIESLKKYSLRTILISSCFGAAFFTLLFGGNIKDFFASFIIGGIIKYVTTVLNRVNINDFFINIVGGSVASLLAIFFVYIRLGAHIDKIIIGSIMLLVPGLAITNAIRDTISGDLVAGISRAVEAFLIAAAIAIGSGLILRLWFIYSGGRFTW